MLKHFLRKSLIALVTIYAIITLSFLMVRFMPGNPLLHLVGHEQYYYLKEFEPQELERIADKYAISGTTGEQYIRYISSIIHLDFGTAYSNKQPVIDNILSAAGWTLVLSVPTFILGGLIGAVLGVLTGWKPGGRLDRILTPVLLFIDTVPSNCIGILFLVVFAFKTGMFPINGMTSGNLSGISYIVDVLWHAALPLMIMVLLRSSSNYLLMKSSVSQVKDEAYTVTARSKGLSERKILFRHVIRNAMLPYISALCIQLGYILSGSMVLEVIFGWKGMGQLYYQAVSKRDFPTAQTCFIISAVLVVLGNLIGETITAAIDPRLKKETHED